MPRACRTPAPPLWQGEGGAYVIDRDALTWPYVQHYMRARRPLFKNRVRGSGVGAVALPESPAELRLLAADAEWCSLVDLVGLVRAEAGGRGGRRGRGRGGAGASGGGHSAGARAPAERYGNAAHAGVRAAGGAGTIECERWRESFLLKKQAAAIGVDSARVAEAAGEIPALIALILRTEAEPLWIAVEIVRIAI